VGVARQYCGVLGEQDNCQVPVTVPLASEQTNVPVAWPGSCTPPKQWAEDAVRRRKAGVPAAVSFATKAEIGLTQLQAQTAQGAPRYCVVADADYGVGTAFRNRLGQLGLPY